MNTRYGRYSATYNMIGFHCFNEELSLLPKNPTEAKLQATSTRGESTEPTKGVMKHTYKLYFTIIAWCNTAVSCSINLWAEKGAIRINGERYPNPWIPVQLVTGKAHNPSVVQHPSHCQLSIAWLHASLVVIMQILSLHTEKDVD
jgi:hypothetical protein